MKEEKLLENLSEIRKSLEKLEAGMGYLMEAVSLNILEEVDEESDGKFSKELDLPKKDDDDNPFEPLQRRSYLG